MAALDGRINQTICAISLTQPHRQGVEKVWRRSPHRGESNGTSFVVLMFVVVKFLINPIRNENKGRYALLTLTLAQDKHDPRCHYGFPPPQGFFSFVAQLGHSNMAAEPLDLDGDLDGRINQTICTITGAPEARSGLIQAVKSLYHQK